MCSRRERFSAELGAALLNIGFYASERDSGHGYACKRLHFLFILLQDFATMDNQ